MNVKKLVAGVLLAALVGLCFITAGCGNNGTTSKDNVNSGTNEVSASDNDSSENTTSQQPGSDSGYTPWIK